VIVTLPAISAGIYAGVALTCFEGRERSFLQRWGVYVTNGLGDRIAEVIIWLYW
jgi:hypothetical protein